MKRLFSSLILALFGILSIGFPALAIAPPPTPIQINNVTVYCSVLEATDQLYLVDFNIPYTTGSGFPTETADQTFYIRLFDVADTTELGAIPLLNNPYYHTGYGKGAISLYFSATDVSTLGLVESSAYNMHLVSTNVSISEVSTPISNWYTSAGGLAISALGTRVLSLASTFQGAWGNLFTLVSNRALVADGENYFTLVIPELRTMCPTIFSSFITQASFPTRPHNAAYALTVRNQWVGTWLDLTTVGTDWGIDPIWIYGIMWLFVTVVIGYLLVMLSNTNKFLFPFVCLMSVFGFLSGFLSYFVGGVVMLVCILVIVNDLYWNKSYA